MKDNIQIIDENKLGLSPGFFGDDLNALELLTEPDPFTYFSIDWPSASNFPTNPNPFLPYANDVLVSQGTRSFSVFADGVFNIGLDFDDDLDALALLDRGKRGTFFTSYTNKFKARS
jgi:hypothetical protein